MSCIFISAIISRRVSTRFSQMEQRIADDFSRIQNSRRRLQHMAKHDSLTALPNRSELELQVSRAIAHSKLEGKLVALVFVDLDNFKRINGQYVHVSGDELLKQIGSRFERILGTNDIVSHFFWRGCLLRKACDETLNLMPNGPEAVGVFLNVSPKQVFELGFDDKVIRLVEEVGIAPCRVTLELTENIFIKDLHIVEPELRRLREYGFGISLDDFGTGFSSLNYLNTLPITEIKIDRSFIGKLNSSQHSETLVRVIIDIGASCQMKVVAEGGEPPEQMAKLQQYHCDLRQGYYYDKPLFAQGLVDAYFPAKLEDCVISTIRAKPHSFDAAGPTGAEL
ncbi:bifunctional diguanylate cyclase/phosphodiesterase [Vibrio sp. Isolate32]|uniref:bifunctional diguanylate cyclase/phosphodiesterase n=2 Tax=unclassified Vibrio TaxID=2614977 RepID=UPI0031F30091